MNVNDKISMEYESRSMISEEQYLVLLNEFSNKEKHSVSIVNYYFDTKDLFLTNHHMVLRKRFINENEIEITLKIKDKKGDAEITNKVDSDSLNIAEEIGSTAKTLLQNNGINLNDLANVGKLSTYRTEISQENYLVVIDKNSYNNIVDFNIEVESDSKENASKQLLAILSKYNIKITADYISKSRRVILKI